MFVYRFATSACARSHALTCFGTLVVRRCSALTRGRKADKKPCRDEEWKDGLLGRSVAADTALRNATLNVHTWVHSTWSNNPCEKNLFAPTITHSLSLSHTPKFLAAFLLAPPAVGPCQSGVTNVLPSHLYSVHSASAERFKLPSELQYELAP